MNFYHENRYTQKLAKILKLNKM